MHVVIIPLLKCKSKDLSQLEELTVHIKPQRISPRPAALVFGIQSVYLVI